jgi:hypothetical protein
VERTLIVEVETSLVAVHEGEGGLGGEAGEGIGDAIEGISGRLGGSFVFEQAGFESPGAAKAPVGSDHLLDQADFNAIGRLQATEVIFQDSLETLGRFISHDEMAGEQAVADGILGRLLLAPGSNGTGGASPIGPGSKNAPTRRH